VKKLRAAVFGASGYSGGELLRLLARHAYVSVEKAYAQSSAGVAVADVHGWSEPALSEFEAFEQIPDAEICFLALPHGEAMKIATALLDAGKIVIDLSGDHRLTDAALFKKYYGIDAAWSKDHDYKAVYGLPEWNFDAIRTARLIANPGCYATSAILALAPLLADTLIDAKSIVINSMSGVSGAGRKAAIEYSFVEVNENVKAYRLGDHQHIPEIESALHAICGLNAKVTFVPHLIPITRGIYSTIVANVLPGVTEEQLVGAFAKHYAGKPFVRFNATRVPEIRRVTNTNYIDITLKYLPERNQVILISTLDNLVKGAAGQAVQNMNIACGFSETEGLV
jgi:N-acetyl-gamma-glutamyl-phosphate reductase